MSNIRLMRVILIILCLPLGSLAWEPRDHPGTGTNSILCKPFLDLRLTVVGSHELLELRTNGVVITFQGRVEIPEVRYKNEPKYIDQLKKDVVSFMTEESGRQIRLVKADRIIQSEIGTKGVDIKSELLGAFEKLENGDIIILCSTVRKIINYKHYVCRHGGGGVGVIYNNISFLCCLGCA